MQLKRRAFVLLLMCLISWSGSAGADLNAVCRAIAATANGRAGEAEEAETDDLVEKVISSLPAGTQYLEPRPVEGREVLDILGCKDLMSCKSDLLPDWLLNLKPDPNLAVAVIDTRPWSDIAFVLAHNWAGCRQVFALKQTAEHGWYRLPLGAIESEKTCHRGLTVIRSGSTPYLVIPNFSSSFAKADGPSDGRESKRVSLHLIDPMRASEAAGRDCAVTYLFTPRLVPESREPLLAPSASDREAVLEFVDKTVTALAVKTAFYKGKGAQIILADDFIAASTAPGELKSMREQLSRAEGDGLADQAMRVLVAAGAKQLPPEVQGAARLIPVGFGGRAYVALLTEYEEFAMPVDNWPPVIALFAITGMELKALAAFRLREATRFDRAEASLDNAH